MNTINFRKKFPASNPGIQAVAAELQRLISTIFPNAVVSQDEDNVGYGFGSGYKDLVFVISPYKQHVNLGIANGASLDDPHHLMSGKGRVHRHVKLHDIQQLQSQELMDLMERAFQAAQEQYRER